MDALTAESFAIAFVEEFNDTLKKSIAQLDHDVSNHEKGFSCREACMVCQMKRRYLQGDWPGSSTTPANGST